MDGRRQPSASPSAGGHHTCGVWHADRSSLVVKPCCAGSGSVAPSSSTCTCAATENTCCMAVLTHGTVQQALRQLAQLLCESAVRPVLLARGSRNDMYEGAVNSLLRARVARGGICLTRSAQGRHVAGAGQLLLSGCQLSSDVLAPLLQQCERRWRGIPVAPSELLLQEPARQPSCQV